MISADSFSCFGLLVFFFHVSSWHGLSVYYSVEDKDRLVGSTFFKKEKYEIMFMMGKKAGNNNDGIMYD